VVVSVRTGKQQVQARERARVTASPPRDVRGITIGELARAAGLRASAIRFYESAGILPTPRRQGGRRVYDAVALDHLAVVRLAQQAGFTVAEIRTLVGGFRAGTSPSVRWRALAARKLEEVEALIARAQTMRATLEAAIECGCLTLEECGRRAAGCLSNPAHGRMSSRDPEPSRAKSSC